MLCLAQFKAILIENPCSVTFNFAFASKLGYVFHISNSKKRHAQKKQRKIMMAETAAREAVAARADMKAKQQSLVDSQLVEQLRVDIPTYSSRPVPT